MTAPRPSRHRCPHCETIHAPKVTCNPLLLQLAVSERRAVDMTGATCATCGGPIRPIAHPDGRPVWVHAAPDYDPFDSPHVARPAG